MSNLTAVERDFFYRRGPRPRPFSGQPPRLSRVRSFRRLCKAELGTMPDIVDVLAQMDASEDAAYGEGEGEAAEVEEWRLRYARMAVTYMSFKRAQEEGVEW